MVFNVSKVEQRLVLDLFRAWPGEVWPRWSGRAIQRRRSDEGFSRLWPVKLLKIVTGLGVGRQVPKISLDEGKASR